MAMYEVGVGESPMGIAGYLSGNPYRYTELLAANPHKPIVFIGGLPTFASLGVGEKLIVPDGLVGARFDANVFAKTPIETLKQIGDWTFVPPATWYHKKDRDSNPRMMTDTVFMPIQPAPPQGRTQATIDHYKKLLDDVRALRIHCDKTGGKGKECKGTGAGDIFGAVLHNPVVKAAGSVVKYAVNPKELLDQIPGVKEITKYLPDAPDPVKLTTDLVDAAVHGDLKKLKDTTLEIGHTVANVVSMVPGVGNVIGGPLSAAITLLETGSPLKAVLSLLLNEIPGIPPQIRDILRVAFNAIADIVEGGKSVTDVILYEFKEGVKAQTAKAGISGTVADLIESALDGAIQVIFQSKPLDKAALDLAKDGLEVATKKVAKGAPIPKEITEMRKTVSDLEKVYDDVNETYARAQDIIKLAKQDPKKQNAAIQKQIKDLRAVITKKKSDAQAKGKKFKKAKSPKLRSDLPPTYRATTPAPKPPAKSPKLRTDLPPTYRAPAPSPARRPPTPAPAPAPSPKAAVLRPRTAQPAKAPAPAQARPTPTYGPYPQSVQATGVSAPRGGGRGGGGPHHDGGGHHRGGGGGPHPHHGSRPFIQPPHARGWGWPVQWWDTPWSPEVITRTETCQTWGDSIEMPPAMQNAAKMALGMSKGRPTTVRGPDNMLYLFSYENGVTTARPCAAVAASA